jgi:hypothetical protein
MPNPVKSFTYITKNYAYFSKIVLLPHTNQGSLLVTAINQLLSLTNEFGKALDEGKEIRVVFCDISKAFDRVWHKGLLKIEVLE